MSATTITRAIALFAASVLLAAGCGGSDAVAGGNAAKGVTLRIVEPQATTTKLPVTLKLELAGARLITDPGTTVATTPDSPVEGHLHVSIDGQLIAMTDTLEQVLPIDRPGTYLVQVEFVDNYHVPFKPRIQHSVRFTASK